jgi:hypothetical protein
MLQTPFSQPANSARRRQWRKNRQNAVAASFPPSTASMRLASDRQYRKALPLHEAMARVASEPNAAFDPRVVAILQRGYVEGEKLARLQPLQAPPKLSTDVKVERGLAPDAGFARTAESPQSAFPARETAERLTAARHEAQTLS